MLWRMEAPTDEFLPVNTPRLILRRLNLADLEPFLAYRNDPEVARYQSWESINRAEATAFIQQHTIQPFGAPGEWLQIGIAERETNRLIGDCGLKFHESDARQATFGITLSSNSQGRGLACEALSALFDFLFQSLHRIQADTDLENQRAWKLMDRLGMRREAHHRQRLWFKGAWADEYIYAILRDEWLQHRDSILRRP